MSNLAHRSDVIFINQNSRPGWGAGYRVTPYRPGGYVATASSGTSVAVRKGHGFKVSDKFLLVSGSTYDGATMRSISAISIGTSSDTLTINSGISLAVDDVLINLGPDTGSSTPNYDGSDIPIYSNMDGETAYTSSEVTADSTGQYAYWHRHRVFWELIRNSNLDAVGYNIVDQAIDGVVYAHEYVTGGSGTASDPWVTASSNPISAALAALPAVGVAGKGVIRLIPGVYDLGSGSVGVAMNFDGVLTSGITIEGVQDPNPFTTSVTEKNDNAAVLVYSGTGSAFKVGDFTSTGSTFCHGFIFRNFKLRQTGTAGTGVGFECRLLRSSLFEHVCVTDFDTGISLASVSDFNVFRECEIQGCHDSLGGTGYGILVGATTGVSPTGQCNGNQFLKCDIAMPARDHSFNTWGIYITENSVANVIRDSYLHNYDTAGYGAVGINSAGGGHVDGATVDGCYIEGCAIGVYHSNAFTTDTAGVTISNNFFTQTETYGVRINSGSTGKTRGVLISGNVFTQPSNSSPYNTAIGISTGAYVDSAVIVGNSFKVGTSASTAWAGGNIDTGGQGAVQIENNALGMRGAYGATLNLMSITEELTIAASATTDTSANLLPANSVIHAVVARVTTAIPTAATFTIGDSTQASRFATGVSTSLDTTAIGVLHLDPTVASANLGPVQTAAAKIRITPNATPGAATGKVRLVVFYTQFVAPTS